MNPTGFPWRGMAILIADAFTASPLFQAAALLLWFVLTAFLFTAAVSTALYLIQGMPVQLWQWVGSGLCVAYLAVSWPRLVKRARELER